jgi:hypothetical protein
MKKFLFLFTILVVALLIGCANQKKLDVIPALGDLPQPKNLVVENGDQRAILNWDIGGEIDSYVLGYNVYVGESSLIDLPLEKLPHPTESWPPFYVQNDTINSWTHYELDDLENGEKYFVHVRLTGANSRISLPSNEVMITPRPEGDIILYETSSRHYSAFDFSEQELTASTSKPGNIFFDFDDETPMLKSPHLRKNGLTQTQLCVWNGEDTLQISELEFTDKIEISKGQEIILKTSGGNFAKLQIKEIGGKYPDHYVQLNYIYQMIPNLLKF